MSITVLCTCGRSVSFRDDLAGQTRRCVYCEAPLRVGADDPAAGPEPVVDPPAPAPGPAPAAHTIPWEDGSLTLTSRWWRTWWRALVSPADLFARADWDGGHAAPLTWFLGLYFVAVFPALIMGVLAAMVMAGSYNVNRTGDMVSVLILIGPVGAGIASIAVC